MVRLLLGFAALGAASIATPATAQSLIDGDFAQSNGGQQFHFTAPHKQDGRFESHRDRRVRGRFGEALFAGDSGYDLGSSYDDRDWGPDSGNGWWNDRPDRAFPRWVQHNQNCTPDRMWWSGSGWHC